MLELNASFLLLPFYTVKRQIREENIMSKKSLRIFLDKFMKNTNKTGFKKYFKKAFDNLGI